MRDLPRLRRAQRTVGVHSDHSKNPATLAAPLRGRGKASGVDAGWRYGAVWTVHDAKVISVVSYLDPAKALEGVGLGSSRCGSRSASSMSTFHHTSKGIAIPPLVVELATG
jgi:hypothetical protein